MKIFCCKCEKEIEARLTDGGEIYPHRRDLYELPFWICDTCKNFVGCHHKTKNRTNPLGIIATPEIKKARIHIHDILDPLWKKYGMKRGKVYNKISDRMGYSYHTAELKTIDECRKVYRVVKDLYRELKA